MGHGASPRRVLEPQNRGPSRPAESAILPSLLQHCRDLLACSAAWFLPDIIIYSSNLCQSHSFEKHHNAFEAGTAFEAAFKVAKLQDIVACCATIPGNFAAVFLIDRVGRVRIQVVGLVLMAVLYFSGACIYWEHKTGKLFTILYGLTFFFANCGPNTTTFIVPAKLFPARSWSTCHGIAVAAGKVRVIIGAMGVIRGLEGVDQNGYQMTLSMRVMLIILGDI